MADEPMTLDGQPLRRVAVDAWEIERRPFVIPSNHEPFATGGLVRRPEPGFGAAVHTEPLPDTGRAPADQTYTVVTLDVSERFPEFAELMLRLPVRVEGGE